NQRISGAFRSGRCGWIMDSFDGTHRKRKLERNYTKLQPRIKLGPMTFTYQWLGQAGFLFQLSGRRIVIDPYLSNALEEKYRGSRFPHQRMAPPPVQADELTDIDWVLCTHQHTDHMDAQTLLPIHKRNPECRFLVPRAWENKVLEMGIASDRLHTIDFDESLRLNDDIAVTAIPAAHEEVKFTDEGHSWFLGYVI